MFALLFSALYIIDQHAYRDAELKIRNTLTGALLYIEQSNQTSFEFLTSTARQIAKDSRVFPFVYARDGVSLSDLSDEITKRLKLESVMFIDSKGVVLARIDKPSIVGRNILRKSALVSAALKGQECQGYMRKQKRLYQIIAVPIVDNVAPDITRGALVIAAEFSHTLTDNLNKLTGYNMMSITKRTRKMQGKLETSFHTLSDETPQGKEIITLLRTNPEFKDKLFQQEQSPIFKFYLDEKEIYGVAYPLKVFRGEAIGCLLTFIASDKLLEPFHLFRNRLLQTGGVFFILGSLMFFWVSKRFNLLIQGLVKMTQNIRRGAFDLPMPQDRSDEIGYLSRSIHKMSRELKEKDDLERHLALVSQSVEESPEYKTEPSVVDEYFDNPEAELDLPVGLEFSNRYIIRQMIGQGGSATVYHAHDKDLHEDIALKAFGKLEINEANRMAVKRELVLSRKITHRNVLRLYDVNTFEGIEYITMEYIKGTNLSRLLKFGERFNLENGIILARQICYGVMAAHEVGVIHCDLKPSNVLIANSGEIKISDFGISQFQLMSIKNRKNVNRDKPIIGTPAYMSPEQFRNEPLDARTDIYSLGIMFYKIFTNAMPWEGNDFTKLAEKHLHDEPPTLSDRGIKAPKALEKIIARALKKDPAHRYLTVRHMADALSEIKIYN